MASFHVAVSDSVFPNLDRARKVPGTAGAKLRVAGSSTPEAIVTAPTSAGAFADEDDAILSGNLPRNPGNLEVRAHP